MVAGAVALAGLVVLHADAHSLFEQLLHGAALGRWSSRCWRERARSGWCGAPVRGGALQRGGGGGGGDRRLGVRALPDPAPGLSVDRAASPHDTLVVLVVAVLAGGVLLFPALGLLFRLTLTGSLRSARRRARGGAAAARARGGAAAPVTSRPSPATSSLGTRLAVALLIAGIGLLNVASASWAHTLGVLSLLAFVIVAFQQIVLRALADDTPMRRSGRLGQLRGSQAESFAPAGAAR